MICLSEIIHADRIRLRRAAGYFEALFSQIFIQPTVLHISLFFAAFDRGIKMLPRHPSEQHEQTNWHLCNRLIHVSISLGFGWRTTSLDTHLDRSGGRSHKKRLPVALHNEKAKLLILAAIDLVLHMQK